MCVKYVRVCVMYVCQTGCVGVCVKYVRLRQFPLYLTQHVSAHTHTHTYSHVYIRAHTLQVSPSASPGQEQHLDPLHQPRRAQVFLLQVYGALVSPNLSNLCTLAPCRKLFSSPTEGVRRVDCAKLVRPLHSSSCESGGSFSGIRIAGARYVQASRNIYMHDDCKLHNQKEEAVNTNVLVAAVQARRSQKKKTKVVKTPPSGGQNSALWWSKLRPLRACLEQLSSSRFFFQLVS
jgi:hypothetical protein